MSHNSSGADEFADGVVRREVARQNLTTAAERRAFVRGRAATLRNERWLSIPEIPHARNNENERHARIRAYERYADGKL